MKIFVEHVVYSTTTVTETITWLVNQQHQIHFKIAFTTRYLIIGFDFLSQHLDIDL